MKSVAIGNEVYHWPEFKALCERLGVPWKIASTKMTIKLEFGSEEVPVIVEHEYICDDKSKM